jgi:hypothetical protein
MRLLGLSAGCLLIAAALGCGSSGDDAAGAIVGAGAAGNSLSDTGTGGSWVLPDGQGDGAVPRNPLCGVGGCDPDPTTKVCISPPTPKGDASDGGAEDAEAEAEADAPDAAATPDADSGDAAGDADADATLDAPRDGASETTVVVPKPEIACYVRAGDGGVGTACAKAGPIGEEQTCADSTDCEAGLGCVQANGAATLTGRANICRQLQCALAHTCGAGKFYEELPLHQHGETLAAVLVPVCSPVDHCALFTSSCPLGKTCMIVGEGETTCITPGTAKAGEPCDTEILCAGGHTCSKSSGTCKRLCRVGIDSCGTGMCQGGSTALPDKSVGVCVGELTDGG